MRCAVLESALRERKLDRTLTTALPPLERSDPAAYVADDIAAAGCVSAWRPSPRPVLGARRPALVRADHASTAAAWRGHAREARSRRLSTRCDRLDVAQPSAAGIDLDRLLWIRGAGTHRAIAEPAQPAARDLIDRRSIAR